MTAVESRPATEADISKILAANSKAITSLPDEQQSLYHRMLVDAKKAAGIVREGFDVNKPLDLKDILRVQEEFLAKSRVDSLHAAKSSSKARRGRPPQEARSGVDALRRSPGPNKPAQATSRERTIKVEAPVKPKEPVQRQRQPKVQPSQEPSTARAARQTKADWAESPLTPTPEAETQGSPETNDGLPEGWEYDAGRVDLPDGRRIIMDTQSSIMAIILTKNAVGADLKPEDMIPIKPAGDKNNREFLSEEFPGLTDDQIANIQSRLHHDRTESRHHGRLNNIAFDKARYEAKETRLNLPAGWLVSDSGELISSNGPTGYSIEFDADGYPLKVVRPSGSVMREIKVEGINTAESQFDQINPHIEQLITRLDSKSPQQNDKKHQEYFDQNFDSLQEIKTQRVDDLVAELALAESRAGRIFAKKSDKAQFEQLNGQLEQAKRDLRDDFAEKLYYDISQFQRIVNDPESSYEERALALKNMEALELSATAGMLNRLARAETIMAQARLNVAEERRFAGLPVGRWAKGFRSVWTEHPKTRLAISAALTGISVVAATTGFVPVAGAAMAAKKAMGTYGAYVGSENIYKAGSALRQRRAERKTYETGRSRAEALAADDEQYQRRSEELKQQAAEGLSEEAKQNLLRFIESHPELGSMIDFELTQSLIADKIKADSEQIAKNPKTARRAKLIGLGAAALVGFGSIFSYVKSIDNPAGGRPGGGGGGAAEAAQPQTPAGAVAPETTTTLPPLGDVNPPGPGISSPVLPSGLSTEQLQVYNGLSPDKQAAFNRFAQNYSSLNTAQRAAADAAFAQIVERPDDFKNMWSILGPNPSPEQIENFNRYISGA